MTSKLVLMLYQSWNDLDATIAGITPHDATTPVNGFSAVAWSVGHVTNMLDSWVNVRFQHLTPNPVISNPDLRTGGSGRADDWPAILRAVEAVRNDARQLLDSADGVALETVIPYDGSIPLLRQSGLRLRYAVMRIAAHHWMHAGEINTVQSQMGVVDTTGPNWGPSLV